VNPTSPILTFLAPTTIFDAFSILVTIQGHITHVLATATKNIFNSVVKFGAAKTPLLFFAVAAATPSGTSASHSGGNFLSFKK
jgi:hypothetical protein